MCLAIPEELHNNRRGKEEEELHNNRRGKKEEEELHNNRKGKEEEELLQPEQAPLPLQYLKVRQYRATQIMIQTQHKCLLAIR
jgi:hypothetical protein